MGICCEFLGLEQPLLPRAADYLIDRYVAGQSVDMGSAIVVVPGGLAGRRLLELLVQETEQRTLILTPPQIVTVGRLPELLYQPQRPFATTLVQQLAWAHVLQHAPSEQRAQIFSNAPSADDSLHWLELGDVIRRQHTELAADGLHFGDVASHTGKLETAGELARWQALREIQTAYLRLLDELELWDVQTARLVAVDKRECRTEQDIILLSTVDINLIQRRMLDQVSDHVTALVFAPDAWASRFDNHGCLLPKAWDSVIIDIDEARVHVVDGPDEQAEMVARTLADYRGQYRPDEITVGLADETITPYIQRQLQQCRVASRSAAGVALSETAPYRLLDAVAAYIHSGRYPEFAALVRHPDMVDLLERREVHDGWLEQLDGYHCAHPQPELGRSWPGRPDTSRLVRQVYALVSDLLEPWTAPAQPLSRWSDTLADFLLSVYGHRGWDRDAAGQRVYWRSFEHLQSVAEQLRESIPDRLMPVVAAADALRLILVQLQSLSVPPLPDENAVELLGWLELPLDDAPAVVVTSFNEGFVPSSVNSDMFLPNTLRTVLEIQDNARRYARDAYALSVLRQTREDVDLIVARHNSNGDPLAPSRLLFRSDCETMARRALTFFGRVQPMHELPPLEGGLVPGSEQSGFVVPVPDPVSIQQPLVLSVTAFRDYLACPYRFYLRRVLRLQAMDDEVEELDGGQFGTLLHEVLHQFGDGPCRGSSDSGEISDFLNEALSAEIEKQYNGTCLPSVLLQVEQLRMRLNALAEKQAVRAAEGWRILHTEIPGPDDPDTEFDVDGDPVILRGRIDRIDRHEETGQMIILDYKSSDSGRAPEQAHRRRKTEWVDLQLPLYRHLARSLDVAGAVQLGYVLLPKDTNKVDFSLASWSEDELQEADEVARDVVRGIRQQRFWRPTEPPPSFFEEFAAICQDGVIGRRPFEKVSDGDL
jgi:hypothetical protein